jgi:RNA polymerase sigma-70 factor (ECF subfamily)
MCAAPLANAIAFTHGSPTPQGTHSMTQAALLEETSGSLRHKLPARAASALRPYSGAAARRGPVARIPAPTRRIGVRPGVAPHTALPAASLDDAVFAAQLLLVIPNLRGFSRKLARGPGSEDLVQDALLRAWNFRAKYQPGTNLKAWVFTILRNLNLSGQRRGWRNQPLDPAVAENTLVANDDPSACEELLDVRNAMHRLSDDQRDALIMVGAGGLSYKEAAKIWACAEGTVKSRVSRAREALTAMIATSETRPRVRTGISSTEVFDEIMQHATRLRGRLALT